MRISDWSSDVCSSDLVDDAALRHRLDRRAFASSDPVAVPAQPATGLGLAVLREQRAAHWPWQLALQRGERLVAGRDVRRQVSQRFLQRFDQLADATFVVLELREVVRSEEHTSELQSLMRISYAVF